MYLLLPSVGMVMTRLEVRHRDLRGGEGGEGEGGARWEAVW